MLQVEEGVAVADSAEVFAAYGVLRRELAAPAQPAS